MKRRVRQIREPNRQCIKTFKACFRYFYHPTFAKEAEDYWNEKLIEFVESDARLSRQMRDIVARGLRRSFFPERLPTTREEWRERENTAAIILKKCPSK
jgi:hypothetical protein